MEKFISKLSSWKVVNWIKRVIKGNWRNLIGYETKESKRRYEICKTCEHNIRFSGVRLCELCGCPLKSKTKVEEEKCLINKW